MYNGNGGHSGSVTVKDWYLAEENKLARIVFDDGTELTTEEIEELVQHPGEFVPVAGVTLSPASADLVHAREKDSG